MQTNERTSTMVMGSYISGLQLMHGCDMLIADALQK